MLTLSLLLMLLLIVINQCVVEVVVEVAVDAVDVIGLVVGVVVLQNSAASSFASVRQVRWPAVGREDRLVELAVGVRQAGRSTVFAFTLKALKPLAQGRRFGAPGLSPPPIHRP
jgi:hypothetical protein